MALLVKLIFRPLQVTESLKVKGNRIKFIDGSWHMDKTRKAKAEFLEGHIPGAVFFDIDEVADKSVDLPHM